MLMIWGPYYTYGEFYIHEELEVVTVFQGNHPQMALSWQLFSG